MPPPDQIPLPVPDADLRSKMYTRIADVHRQLVEAKWRATGAGKQILGNPRLILHCEEATAFLAEELLRLQKTVEKLLPETVNDVADRLENPDAMPPQEEG